jgi:hypothetical protein
MQNKRTFTEENIEKLLKASYDKKYQLDHKYKNDILEILEQKVAQNSKNSKPKYNITIWLSIVWFAFIITIFSELKISSYMLDLLRPALGLSMVFIPVSCIVLIILKKSLYEKNMV